MTKKKETVIYTYKYLIQRVNVELVGATEIMILSGTASYHDDIVESFIENGNISQVCRIYLHEIDTAVCETPEMIKICEKEGN